MKASPLVLRAAALLSCLVVVAPASAAEPYVSPDDCKPRDCTCADAPMMEAFLENQRAALSAWRQVDASVYEPGGPQTGAQARKAYDKLHLGDPRVSAQFMSCSTYDAKVNSLGRIGGVTFSAAGVELDKCFCETFCKDIVEQTIVHEKVHLPTLIAAGISQGVFTGVCKAGLIDAAFCDSQQAQNIASSEVLAHQAGVASLQKALDALKKRDPEKPEMECTWQPLPADWAPPEPEAAARSLPAPPPAGFWSRVQMLASRLVHGARFG